MSPLDAGRGESTPSTIDPLRPLAAVGSWRDAHQPTRGTGTCEIGQALHTVIAFRRQGKTRYFQPRRGRSPGMLHKRRAGPDSLFPSPADTPSSGRFAVRRSHQGASMTEPNRRAVVRRTGLSKSRLRRRRCHGLFAARPAPRRLLRTLRLRRCRATRPALSKVPYAAKAPTLPAPIANSIMMPGAISGSSREGVLRRRGQPVPAAAVPPRLPLRPPGDGEPRARRVATPIAYQASLFDMAERSSTRRCRGSRLRRLRIHSFLNSPSVLDELIVFLGASYYRFLGRDELYGLSARGLP